MQRIYLLLRNNKQSGPHTLDELINLALKPFDLIWIEGKSSAWSYPSEVAELKAHVKETKQPETRQTSKKESSYPTAGKDIVMAKTSQPAKKSNDQKKKVYIELPDEYKKNNAAPAKEKKET